MNAQNPIVTIGSCWVVTRQGQPYEVQVRSIDAHTLEAYCTGHHLDGWFPLAELTEPSPYAIDPLMGPLKRIDEIARAIVTYGHPIAVGWYDDGDVESGPRGGVWYGFRWGQLTITRMRGHEALVETRKCGDAPWGKGEGYPLIFSSTSDPYVLAALDAIEGDETLRARASLAPVNMS